MRELLAAIMAENTFEPFAFVMNNGNRYQVLSFEMAVHEDDIITVFRHRSNAKDILRFNAITSLEILDS